MYLLQKSYSAQLSGEHRPLLKSGSIVQGNQLFTLYGKKENGSGVVLELNDAALNVVRSLNGQNSIDHLSTNVDSNALEIVSALEDRFPGIFDYPGDDVFEKRKKFAEAASRLSNRHAGEVELETSSSLTNYHQKGMSGEAFSQFENIETTVSHMFREPRQALRGKTFGAMLALRVKEEGLWDGTGSVLEIGGGTGYLAREFLAETSRSIESYSILDISPNLHQSQLAELSDFDQFELIKADALIFDFSSLSPSFILSNEVIADFSVGRVGLSAQFSEKELEREDRDAQQMVERYGLEVLERGQLLNLGAISLIERLAPLVQAGATAWISEYGGEFEPPRRVSLDGHAEHSIQFSHLLRVSEALGLKVELFKMSDFLDFDMEKMVLDVPSFEVLNFWIRSKLDRESLAKLSWTEAELREEMGEDLLSSIYNLNYSSMINTACHLTPELFYVLILRSQN